MQIRGLLPKAVQQLLTIKSGELVLRVPAEAGKAFTDASSVVTKAMGEIEARPVIPREIEDILAITTTERRRWLDDGRLPSAGTRTVKLRGRGKITFHVFDPQKVQELLESDVIDAWREDDAEKAAEKRRQAAWKAKLARSDKSGGTTTRSDVEGDENRFKLRGWAEFERNGPR